MPNYGQYGNNPTWKDRFDSRQVNALKRNFHKSDGYFLATVIKPDLSIVTDVPTHIFNTSIRSIGVKQLSCHPDYALPQGTIINYVDNKKYICFDMDFHQSVNSFGRIHHLNTVLKWVDGNGILRSEHGVDNEALGVQDTSRQIVEVAGRKNIWLQDNILTRELTKNTRFVFGGIEAYKITFIDNWSRDGMILMRLETTQLVAEDDLVNNVAYNGQSNFVPQPINNIQFSVNELKVTQGYSATVQVTDTTNPLETFSITIVGLPSGAYEITSLTSNSVTVKCKEYYYDGIIRATRVSNPLQFAEIPIILKGLF
jgi:hypothetical protein